MLTPLGTSLSRSTLASHARQVGRHGEAARLDAWALALATYDDERADATSGLVADAIGLGDARAATERLPAAADAAGTPTGRAGWRSRTRLAWVRAELGLLTGDGSAVGAAEAAVDEATRAAAPRHAAKSLLVRGVARLESGDRTGAAADLLRALDEAREHGLLPLVWPAAQVAAEAVPERAGELRATAAGAVTAIVAGLGEHGAAFAARPDVRDLLGGAPA